MATDMQRLIVSLEARTKAFENALNKANGVANRRARAIEGRFAAMNRNLNSQFVALNSTMVGAFAGVASAKGFTSLLDAATRIENALKVAGLAGDELTKVYDRLFESAQRNAAPLESLVTLYGRAAIVQRELGVTSEELLRFTDNVAMALRVAGSDAQSASGALLQLSQALGSGTVRAEEFNSILEGALPIAQAAAAGLEEAGGSVAKLRALVIDGAVSSEAFFRAFEAGSVILEQKVAGAEMTVSQSFVRLMNVMIGTAREMDSGSDASGRLAGAIDWLATSIEGLDFSGAINGALDFAESLVGVINTIREYARAAGEATGAAQFGPWLRSRMGGDTDAQELTPESIRDWAARNGVGPTANTTPKTGRLTAAPARTVSLADFMPPAAAGGGVSGGGGGSRGGASRARDELREAEKAARDFERAQQDAARAAEDMGSAVGDAVSGLVDAFADGKIEASELLGIVTNLVQQMLRMNGPGGFGGGLLSSLLGGFGGFFAEGGRLGAGRWGIAGEAGPEIIRGPANIVPMSAPRIPQSGTNGGTVVINAPINAAGADPAALARVEKAVRDLGNSIPRQAIDATHRQRVRGGRPLG